MNEKDFSKSSLLFNTKCSGKLQKCYEDYNEIAEAVAERLLDLHCRLISLYILNEADSLSWHSQTAFYEKKRRCSYIIQMWWLYMQGGQISNILTNILIKRTMSEIFIKSFYFENMTPKIFKRHLYFLMTALKNVCLEFYCVFKTTIFFAFGFIEGFNNNNDK